MAADPPRSRSREAQQKRWVYAGAGSNTMPKCIVTGCGRPQGGHRFFAQSLCPAHAGREAAVAKIRRSLAAAAAKSDPFRFFWVSPALTRRTRRLAAIAAKLGA